MIKEATDLISQGNNLIQSQMQQVMEEIMSGKVETPQIIDFLLALNKKGESVEEITAAVSVMRRYATKIRVPKGIILDTCGTGGDKKGTFNVSTAVAFVAAGCDIIVAKHGNRSVSSRCGSADILEALGININMPAEKIEKCLNDIGIAFLFAQNLHPAMKYAFAARKQIGQKTMFNILGPLSNPAGATHQLLGVYAWRWTGILAGVLKNLGTLHALVVCGEDGLDEITTTAKTFVSELSSGRITDFVISPQDFGIKKAKIEDLAGADTAVNARILLEILNGKKGPERDIVVLNAGAAIYVADKAKSIKEGVKLAEESIDSKKALEKLELLKKYSIDG